MWLSRGTKPFASCRTRFLAEPKNFGSKLYCHATAYKCIFVFIVTFFLYHFLSIFTQVYEFLPIPILRWTREYSYLQNLIYSSRKTSVVSHLDKNQTCNKQFTIPSRSSQCGISDNKSDVNIEEKESKGIRLDYIQKNK